MDYLFWVSLTCVAISGVCLLVWFPKKTKDNTIASIISAIATLTNFAATLVSIILALAVVSVPGKIVSTVFGFLALSCVMITVAGVERVASNAIEFRDNHERIKSLVFLKIVLFISLIFTFLSILVSMVSR